MTAEAPTYPAPLPGSLSKQERLERMIRVDHAGEYGAVQIYRGQLAVLRGTASEATIQHMQEQEEVHLATFDKLIVERGVRPSALSPLWKRAGFALGAVTALMGEKAAMACTAAVEEVIDDHYAAQARALGNDEPELKAIIERFRAEEAEHRDIALAEGAEQAPAYRALTAAIKAGSRAAIFLAKRV